MDIFKAIEKRRSYRGAFKETKPFREDLRLIVEAGMKAPSGKNAQTTEFVIVDDAELVGKIRAMHGANKAMQQAPAYIVCVIDREPSAVYEGFSFQIEDCAAAVENMLLYITALGYASVWVDGWLRLDSRAEKIAEMLNIPPSKKIRIILPVGVPSETVKQPPKKTFSERAWFNSYKS